MKKVNAVLGFTRLDEMDRVNDLASRLVKLTRNGKPTWVPATEDRGEGIFLQLDLDAVAAWEQTILATPLWDAHREAHRRNFPRRFSETAKLVDPDTRLPAPRYWLLHTFAHVLIREMAMSCGYGAASLTERIYGWPPSPQREAAAGLLICTTASDSEGTLGGLVALSEPARLAGAGGLGAAPRITVLVGPGVRDAHPERPGGLPARRRLPLLLVRVGDLVREGQPLPRPPLPAQPADRHRRRRPRVLRERRCPLTRSPHSASSSPRARPTALAVQLDNGPAHHHRRCARSTPAGAHDAKELLAAAGLGHADRDRVDGGPARDRRREVGPP